MKVSNSINVTRIYQEQVKKAGSEKTDGEFRKLMQNKADGKVDAPRTFTPPSGVNPNNPVLSGAPVPQADPVETVKFAAEVVANQPDVRAEKVDHIKQLFDAGQYNVAPEKVAERLYASGMVTKSWEA